MKQTEILYQEIDENNVKIIDIKNVANEAFIDYEYGNKILLKYIQNYPYYIYPRNEYNSKNLIEIGIKEKTISPVFIYIEKNEIMSKEKLNKIVSILKQAGERLKNIINKEQNKKVNLGYCSNFGINCGKLDKCDDCDDWINCNKAYKKYKLEKLTNKAKYKNHFLNIDYKKFEQGVLKFLYNLDLSCRKEIYIKQEKEKIFKRLYDSSNEFITKFIRHRRFPFSEISSRYSVKPILEKTIKI